MDKFLKDMLAKFAETAVSKRTWLTGGVIGLSETTFNNEWVKGLVMIAALVIFTASDTMVKIWGKSESPKP